MTRGIPKTKTTVVGDTLNNETMIDEELQAENSQEIAEENEPELITKEEEKIVDNSPKDVFYFHKGDKEFRTRTFDDLETAKMFCENPDNGYTGDNGEVVMPKIVN